MDARRFLRYLAPNLITLSSLLFGLLSLHASLEGRYQQAAWFVIFSVLTDKLDGWVARLLKAASEFGVQADSFADFLNFGIAPATLFFSFLTHNPELPFSSGRGYAIVVVVCVFWVLSVTFRLARYNVVGDDPRCRRIFFGVPTTLAGGSLCALFLMFLKYGAAEAFVDSEFGGPHLVPGLEVGRDIWLVWPAFIFAGAVLMASTVKIPKLGLSKSRLLTVFIFTNVLVGYAMGFARMFPEYLWLTSTSWVMVSIVWGIFSPAARALRPPPIFPPTDRPAAQLPQRPEEDALPDEEDEPEAADGPGSDVPRPVGR